MSEERRFEHLGALAWDRMVEASSTVLEPSGLDKAAVEVLPTGSVVYSYDLLVEAFMDTEGMSYEEAVEWIDYNTLRAIPYMPEPRPQIRNNEVEGEDE